MHRLQFVYQFTVDGHLGTPGSWLSWILLLWTWVCKCLQTSWLIFLSIYTDLRLQIFGSSIFDVWGNTLLFPTVLASITLDFVYWSGILWHCWTHYLIQRFLCMCVWLGQFQQYVGHSVECRHPCLTLDSGKSIWLFIIKVRAKL
jgi:hypothetical protein